MPSAARCHIGTSGWSYKHWRKRFYPFELPASQWLPFYARHFATVEVNNTFYRLPSEETFLDWKGEVPGPFVFAVKMSRYVTHIKRLKDPEEPIELFLRRASRLGRKLGPVLMQLPPRWRADPERLEGALASLPKRRRWVFEFRDRRWFIDEVRALLERYRAAFCIFDMPEVACPHWVTGPFVYLRFHGTEGRYGGGYPLATLSEWAGRIERWLDEGRDVYAYFNNDIEGHAVRDAGRLLREVNRRRQRGG